MGKSLQFSIEPGNNRKVKNRLGQADKFIATAKEYGCDESEKAFDEKLKKVIKATKSN